MAQLIPGRLAVGGLGAMGGAYAVSKEGFLADAFPAWMAMARGFLQSAPQAAAKDTSGAQVELLGASVRTLSKVVDGALRAQRTTATAGAAGTLVLVGAPIAAAAYYFRHHGWWVTPQELQEGLDGVRQGVCERLEEVRVQLLEHIGILEKQGEDTAAWQREVRCLCLSASASLPPLLSVQGSVASLVPFAPRCCKCSAPRPLCPDPRSTRGSASYLAPLPLSPQQSVAMAELAGKLQGVHDTVGTLEKRLEGVEGDVARSARGVELLCEFVASANAPSGEQDRSLQERLQEFTQQPARPALAPPPDQPLPWARPQTTGYLTSVLSGRVSPN